MNDWPTKKLGEVCKVNPTKSEIKDIPDDTFVSFVPMSAVSETSQRIEEQEDRKFAEVKKGYTYFRKGDILFAKITPSMENGKVALANNLKNETGFASTEFHVIRAGEKVLPEYIYRLVASEKFRDEAKTKMTGSAGQKRVPRSFLENYEIPLPSIAEQKKIVARLEGLLGKIKEAKRLRAEAQEAAQNLLPAELHRIFSQPIRQTQGKQHSNILQNVGMSSKSAFVPPTLSASEGRSKNYGAAQWEEKELGEISDVITGNTPKTSISSYYGNEYLWARPGDLNEAYVGSTEKMLSKEGFEKSGVRKILAGAVMMCCIGSIGKIGIASQEMATNQQINAFVPHTKKLDGNFLFYSLIRSREKFISGASSTTLQIINKSRCEAIKIPLPPLAEQKKLVARLDSLSEKIKSLRQAQAKTASDFISLEQSILSKSFSG